MSPTWTWSTFPTLTADDVYDVLALRQAVFVVEQACIFLDADGKDRSAWHLLGRREGRLVAYLRAFPPNDAGDVIIGRVVNPSDLRGQGLGRQVMIEGLARSASTFGPQPTWIWAQSRLARFYGSLGYQVCGPEGIEDGIPHLPMRRPPSAGV